MNMRWACRDGVGHRARAQHAFARLRLGDRPGARALADGLTSHGDGEIQLLAVGHAYRRRVLGGIAHNW